MFAGLSATADLVVDTFTKDQIMNGPSTQNTVFDFTGTILGRERDAADETEFGQAEVIGGELVITGAPNAVVFLVLQGTDSMQTTRFSIRSRASRPPRI